MVNLNDNMIEILRVIIYILLMIFYFTTKIGIFIGLIHLILIVRNPKRYGMSRLLMKFFRFIKVKTN